MSTVIYAEDKNFVNLMLSNLDENEEIDFNFDITSDKFFKDNKKLSVNIKDDGSVAFDAYGSDETCDYNFKKEMEESIEFIKNFENDKLYLKTKNNEYEAFVQCVSEDEYLIDWKFGSLMYSDIEKIIKSIKSINREDYFKKELNFYVSSDYKDEPISIEELKRIKSNIEDEYISDY